MPPTNLIINADDFGFSPAVTDGILDSHTRGILTSTTLMTTMPDRDRAIDLALATPTLGVGIHLCLTQGKPITACKRLRNHAGDLARGVPKLARRLLLSKSARLEALEEWTAQVDYALSRGLRPTHLDSHKHIHHLPMLHDTVIQVAERFNIKWIRCATANLLLPGQHLSLGYMLLARFATSLAKKIDQRQLHRHNFFFGLATTGKTDSATLIKLFSTSPPPGVLEIMVHPGYTTDLTKSDTRLLKEREREHRALTDPAVRTALEKSGITLTHYGRL